MAGIGRFLRREYDAARPVFLFFLVGFLLLFLLVKLVLAQVAIDVQPLSTAVVGALIAAKAALLLDETPLAQALERYRRIVAVVVKTALYGSVTLLLGYAERFVEALKKTHSFGGAVHELALNANHYRLLAWALGVSIVFAQYFSIYEISRRMGQGALAALFFEAPMTTEDLRGTVVNKAGARQR
jgi:hypothetical protein